MRAPPPPVLLTLDKIFIVTSLIGCLAWIVEYTCNRGWRNSMGRTLLVKTSLLASLLGLSALGAFFNLTRSTSLVVGWLGAFILAGIGPVMIWRMVVFHRVAHAMRPCPNGHRISVTARFCPQCGSPVPVLPAD